MDQNKTHTNTLSEQREIILQNNADALLKYGVWMYFFLLIFEGALRKWFLPGLSGPLLIVRDPLAIAMIFYAWKYNIMPTNRYLTAMYIIGIIASFTAIFIGHGNLSVTIYGARILLIHFPLIFLIGVIFNREDVIKMGRIMIWLCIPMTILIAMQFYSPQSAWVNRGVGGDMSGSGFGGAMGYFRPSASFSFTNGTSLFYGFATCFIFYFWLIPNKINRLILMGATMGLIAAVPLSISRGLLFTIVVIGFFVMIAVSRKPKFLGQIIIAILGLAIAMALLSETSFFKTATEVLMARFDSAAKAEGGLEGTIGERYIGGMIDAVFGSGELPFFGYGIGMGTNAGAVMLSGSRSFLISEGEWGRLVGEMGAFLGIAVIFIRLAISLKVTIEGYKRLRMGEILPWLLLANALLIFPQGQWAQPTSLGFSTLVMGICIASFREPKKVMEELNQ